VRSDAHASDDTLKRYDTVAVSVGALKMPDRKMQEHVEKVANV